MSIDPEFDELKREFLGEAQGKIQEMSSLLNEQGTTRNARERMIYLAHQLKGAGGSYGFPSISSDAAALENALEKITSDDSTDTTEIQNRIQSLTQYVEGSLRELAV